MSKKIAPATVEEVKDALIAWRAFKDTCRDAQAALQKVNDSLGSEHQHASAPELNLRLALGDFVITGEWPPRRPE